MELGANRLVEMKLLPSLLTILAIKFARAEKSCQSVLESLECLSDHWKTLHCYYNKKNDPCDDKTQKIYANHHM